MIKFSARLNLQDLLLF